MTITNPATATQSGKTAKDRNPGKPQKPGKPDKPEPNRQPRKGVKTNKANTRPSSKQQIMARLRTRAGVTIEQLQELTGWQAHSIRACLSTLRKSGMAIEADKKPGKATRYRIADQDDGPSTAARQVAPDKKAPGKAPTGKTTVGTSTPGKGAKGKRSAGKAVVLSPSAEPDARPATKPETPVTGAPA